MRERLVAALRRPSGLVLLAAGMLVGLHMAADPLLDPVRGKTFDVYQRLLPATAPDDTVILIGIDDATLAREGRWPWPRARIAELIGRIGALRPAAFGIDILFPDEGEEAGDRALEDALATARPVLATSIVETPGPAAPDQIAGWSVIGDPSPALQSSLAALLAPREAFAAQAAGLGIVRSVPDADGVTRSIPMVWAAQDEAGIAFWPSLSLELARVALGAPGYALRLSPTGYDAVRVADRVVPLTAGGAIWLSDTAAPVASISALDVIEGRAGEAIAGRIALLSVTAAGFDTFHTTPLVATRPGAEIHALLTSQILNGPFPHEPGSAKTVERGVFVLLALLSSVCIAFLAERRWLMVPALAAVVATPVGLGLAAWETRRELYDGVQPAVGLFLLATAGAYFLYRSAEARRQRIGGQFARYLSPRVVDALVRSDADVARSAERRVVTVVFMDMRDFTATSETLPPDAVVATINRFLTIASEEIFATDGTIDKFMGDAVMAFWNAPLDQNDHAERALSTMRGIVRRLESENRDRAAHGAAPIRIGIGVETGPCSVGNFGSDLRYNYTVIGRAANMAARLEAATKLAGVTALAGPAYASLAPDAVRPAGRFDLAGFTDPIDAFIIDFE